MKIAVVIPCYRVIKKINGVLASIPNYIWTVYLIDDGCPENSLSVVNAEYFSFPVVKIKNSKNLGVGGAVKRGYLEAQRDGADIIVKIDGDGQMSGEDLGDIINPILKGVADYAKGNRFLRYETLLAMPIIRIIGNAGLSFLAKISSGYWNISDPTNGYTAIHRVALAALPLDKIDNRYFFESDMLFRLGAASAVVVDVPLEAKYSDEVSNLSVVKALPEFAWKNLRNTLKRLAFCYYIRELNVASFELVLGLLSLGFGIYYGLSNWIQSNSVNAETSTGVIMITMTSIIVGVQMLLSFINFDVSHGSKIPLQVGYGKVTSD